MNVCAICTADIPGTPSRQPLGRDGAMVNVCKDCDEVHPRSGRYSFDDASPRSGVGDGNGRMGINGGRFQRRGRT